MRSSILTGSLLFGVGAILVLPALSARGTRKSRRPPPPSVAAPAFDVEEAPDAAQPPALSEALAPAVAHVRAFRWDDALTSLATARVTSPRDVAMRELLWSEAAFRAGDAAGAEGAALRAAAAAGPDHPGLHARASLTAAELAEARGDLAAATALYTAGVDSLPAASLRARLGLARTSLVTAPEQALAVLAEAAGRDDASPGVLAAAAEAATAAGDRDAALRFLQRLHFVHPASAEARALASHPMVSGLTEAALREGRWQDVLDRVDRLLEADVESASSADLEAVRRASVPAAGAARLELLAGRLARLQKRHAQALPHLAKAALSRDAVGCRAAYLASRSATSLRRAGDAAKWLKQAASGCACEHRDRALQDLAKAAESKDDAAGARAHWARLAQDGSTAAVREEAAWRTAWQDWRAGRKDDATAAFAEIARTAPGSRSAAAARYWSARRLAERGRQDEARAARASLADDFPLEWYGHLAAEEAGIELTDPASCDEGAIEDELARLALAVGRSPRTARELLDLESLGLTDEVLAEVAALGGAPSDGSALKALALSRSGRSREALREFRRAHPDWRRRKDLPAAQACAAWPLHHRELILGHSRRANLRPELVFGLVHQESVFDDRAISHAGARGLMQVMPATGQTIARWLGERVTTPRLLEAELNVRYGTTYLSRLLAESGRVEVALAGYNAGPGRARRWWAESGDDVALFVESIPFDETRDYVKAIAVNERLYRARLQAAGGASGQ